MLIHLSFKRTAALALALGAVTAGPAVASPVGEPAAAHAFAAVAQHAAPVTGGIGQLTPRLAHGYGEHLSQVTSTASYRVTTHPSIVTSGAPADGGFNWGDAGIGAAGGLVLTLLGLGGAVAARGNGRRVEPAATA